MRQTTRLGTFFAALAVAFVSSGASADRRGDDASDNRTDDSMWQISQSYSSSTSADRRKCRIEEKRSKIRVSSKSGRGGYAAYTSVWTVDWTDSFALEYENELRSSRPRRDDQSATTGLAMGFGAFSSESGFPDGVNVETVRTKTTRELRVTLRTAGTSIVLASAPIEAGVHEFDVAWVATAAGTASLVVRVDDDGFSAPTLNVGGFETYFAGREAEGMSIALFGSSTGKFKFESSFDDFGYDGDDYSDDGDDDSWDDGDSSGGSEVVSASSFNAAISAALAASSLPILKVEAELENGSYYVEVLQWNAATGQFRQLLVNAGSFAVVATRNWTPSDDEREDFEDEIFVISTVTVSPTSAVSAAVAAYPGANPHELELEQEDFGPMWKVELVRADGTLVEFATAAR